MSIIYIDEMNTKYFINIDRWIFRYASAAPKNKTHRRMHSQTCYAVLT